MWAGVQDNPGAYTNAGETATNEELQTAQQNQDFWNGVWANFNPQSAVQTSAPSTQAFGNIAKGAQGIEQAGLGSGPTGSAHLGQANQNLDANATSSSKTEDLNNFLTNMNANDKSAEERELSMFGNSQGQQSENNKLFGQATEQAGVSQAQSEQNIANEFNNYNQEQPNPINQIGGAVGGFAGQFAGSKVGKSMFGNNGNTISGSTQETEDETS